MQPRTRIQRLISDSIVDPTIIVILTDKLYVIVVTRASTVVQGEDGNGEYTYFQGILAFSAYIARHAYHELGHQAEYCVLRGVNSTRNI